MAYRHPSIYEWGRDMQPELYLMVHRQHEREVEQRLEHLLAARARADAPAPRPAEHLTAALRGWVRAERTWPVTPDVACCPAA